MKEWNREIDAFIASANKHQVLMLMVGGGAVNFHGYQRHSADVDFWIHPTQENFEALIKVLKDLGYEIMNFPKAVKQQQQNISIKFSPSSLNLELITRFSVNKTFAEAYERSIETSKKDNPKIKWHVLNLDDLITSKIKSERPKDLLDVQELKRINGL